MLAIKLMFRTLAFSTFSEPKSGNNLNLDVITFIIFSFPNYIMFHDSN